MFNKKLDLIIYLIKQIYFQLHALENNVVEVVQNFIFQCNI